MKASELINELNRYIKLYGDLEVVIADPIPPILPDIKPPNKAFPYTTVNQIRKEQDLFVRNPEEEMFALYW